MFNKIGLGGGCHWCTEGVFQSLLGINKVEQGWIASEGENSTFSEAVLIDYDVNTISMKDLIEIHLHTHSSTSNHAFRDKYRSAIYVFSQEQKEGSEQIIKELQPQFDNKIITKVLFYKEFKLNNEEHLNYLYTRTNNAFCENYIHPKLSVLLAKFSNKVDIDKVNGLGLPKT